MAKEKRIYAILKNKIKDVIVRNRVKAFNNALETARLNAELELQQAEDQCIENLKKLSDTDKKPSEIVDSVYKFVQKRRNINKVLDMLKEVESYVNEEIDIDED